LATSHAVKVKGKSQRPNQKPKTKNQKPKTKNQKPKTKNQKPTTKPKLELKPGQQDYYFKYSRIFKLARDYAVVVELPLNCH
jgi:hypothetical protein